MKLRRRRTAGAAVATLLLAGAPPAASAAASAGFDRSGVVTTALPGQSTTAQAVSVDAAGRITVAGSGYSNARRRQTFTMVRYRPDGRRDASFGSKGIVNQLRADRDANAYSENVSMIAQPDGKLVVAGLVGEPATDEDEEAGELVDAIELRRYLPDGAPDVSFGERFKRVIEDPWLNTLHLGLLHAVEARSRPRGLIAPLVERALHEGVEALDEAAALAVLSDGWAMRTLHEESLRV